ncbi:hypothetical protein JCM14076_04500 [Methylosoma difficile]
MADESVYPAFSAHGLLDLRYQNTDASRGWLDNGLGKFRSGGDTDRVRMNEAALSVQGQWWDWSGTVTAKYADEQDNPVDLQEAFLHYRPVSTTPWRFGARLGMFFPPVSFENNGVAWSSPYTLTSSAINSWVGEELRTFGGEANASYQFGYSVRFGVFGALLANNDTAGTLLAWRGWNLHDYEATLSDRLNLPQGTGIQTVFPNQAAYTSPFVELDGSPGYYAGISGEHPGIGKFRILHYDNQTNPEALRGGQYGWHTQFWSFGFKNELPQQLTLIGQGMTGSTLMGNWVGGRREVQVDFWATSLLLSKAFDIHRISIRYDHFATRGAHLQSTSQRLVLDSTGNYVWQNSYFWGNNNENGDAWTVNYNIMLEKHQQINIEMTYLDSYNANRLAIRKSPNQEEILWQLGYRVFF